MPDLCFCFPLPELTLKRRDFLVPLFVKRSASSKLIIIFQHCFHFKLNQPRRLYCNINQICVACSLCERQQDAISGFCRKCPPSKEVMLACVRACKPLSLFLLVSLLAWKHTDIQKKGGRNNIVFVQCVR